jgi:hypothetical protein
MVKLTKAQVVAALRDVHDNDGVMWRVSGFEAIRLWTELKNRGWVRGREITDAGRAALREHE